MSGNSDGERMPCQTHGCDGDSRYAGPGRGHASWCMYPRPATMSQPDPDVQRWPDATVLLGRVDALLTEVEQRAEARNWIKSECFVRVSEVRRAMGQNP